MRRLILLRHAKSEGSAEGRADHERPLALRGRNEAPRIGNYLAHHHLVPDFVLCSTAKRARETWSYIAGEFSREPPIIYENRLYNASPETILQLARETEDRIHALMIIGHNPGLHEFAIQAIASGDIEIRERLRENLPTAGLVVVDFPIENWRKLHMQSGRIEKFIVPPALKAATD